MVLLGSPLVYWIGFLAGPAAASKAAHFLETVGQCFPPCL